MKLDKKKILLNFMESFLLGFMILIFGPAEIFFANITEFEFLYGEFAGYMAILFLVSVLLLTAVLTIMPEKIHRIVLSVIFGISLAGYLQIMFLNKNLDLLGVNPNGYQVQTSRWIGNMVIWLAVIAAVIALAILKKEIWKKLVSYLASFLICIQVVALVSLLATAPQEAYKRLQGSDRLSGEDQYTVSANENIIVFVLDYFSSLYLQQMLEVYPDGADCLHDFT